MNYLKHALVFCVAALPASTLSAPYASCPPDYILPPPPCEEECCPPGAGGPGAGGGGGPAGCLACGRVGAAGMPTWQVRDAHVDYRLFDTPLKYMPAYGPTIGLDMVYQTWRATDLDYYPRNDVNPLFGPIWHCAWNSEVIIYEGYRIHWNYLGGRIVYKFQSGSDMSDPAYRDGSRFELVKDIFGTLLGGRVLTTSS